MFIPAIFVTELTLVCFGSGLRLCSSDFLVNVANVSNHVIAVQKLFEAYIAFVVPFPSVAFHMATKLRFGVESKAANLRKDC